MGYFLLVLCLALEATGLCNGAWVLAAIHKDVAGFQRDEVYIGTAEERAARAKGDQPIHTSEVGHLSGSAFPADHSLPFKNEVDTHTDKRARILANIKALREQIDASTTKDEKQVFQDALSHEVGKMKEINSEQGEAP